MADIFHSHIFLLRKDNKITEISTCSTHTFVINQTSVASSAHRLAVVNKRFALHVGKAFVYFFFRCIVHHPKSPWVNLQYIFVISLLLHTTTSHNV
nr:MAG TPA_asm: hypothetical protein [Caudoviricetes sp.]